MEPKSAPVYPDVVGRTSLSQPAAHWMQNIMLRRRAGTDAPYLHQRQHRDAPNPRVRFPPESRMVVRAVERGADLERPAVAGVIDGMSMMRTCPSHLQTSWKQALLRVTSGLG